MCGSESVGNLLAVVEVKLLISSALKALLWAKLVRWTLRRRRPLLAVPGNTLFSWPHRGCCVASAGEREWFGDHYFCGSVKEVIVAVCGSIVGLSSG